MHDQKLHITLDLSDDLKCIINRFLKEETFIMSQFLDDFNVVLEKIAAGTANDPETKAAVAALQTSVADNLATIAANDADDAATKAAVQELKTAVLALSNKLANSPPTA